jgi:hypothetical protein
MSSQGEEIIINGHICYTCFFMSSCNKPESKSPDGTCSEWVHYRTKLPCQTVEMMVEPKDCKEISENGNFCCCEHARKLKLVKEDPK